MKILVTGGLGFIGSAFVHMFHEKYELHIVDAVTYAADISNLNGLSKYVGLTVSDIGDPVRMTDLFYRFRPDVMINFAAESHVDRSINGDDIFYQSNVKGVLNLLHCCLKYKVKLVHISTDECYGQLTDDEDPWTEESPMKPRNPYASSKASAEHLVMAYHHTHKLDVVITRGSNTYGFRQKEKLIPTALIKLHQGKKIPVYGRGLQKRDWLYVDDHVRGIECAMLRGQSGQAYNIPGNRELQNIDTVRHLIATCNLHGGWNDLDHENCIEYVDDRKGHDFAYRMNGDKLKSLGWNHQMTFLDGLVETVNWYYELFSQKKI